jgi:hypothetical protein
MATFQNFYDFIIPYCRGIDQPLVDFQLRQAVRDWQKSTTMWRESVPFTLKQGMTDYQVQPSSGGVTAGIYSFPYPTDASRGMEELPEVSRWSEGYLPEPGTPDGWWQIYPGVFRLNRPPDKDYPITLGIYKQMSQDPDDDYIPDDLFENYAQSVASGALAQILAMSSKPWNDTTMATYHNTEFVKAKLALRSKMRRGGNAGRMRVVAPFFAGRVR